MSVSNCSSSRGYPHSGDQTGTEYYVCDWYRYSSGWDRYLIYEGDRADEVNALAAQYARAAANNNRIGYSQPDRYSMWNMLVKYGYDPAKIVENCNADCSSSTTFIFKAIGYVLGIKALQDLNIYIYTGNMESAFKAAGFASYSDSKYLNSPDYIKAGGVLLNEKHHVVINLDNGSKSGGTEPTTDNPYDRLDIVPYESNNSVKEIQARLQVLGYYHGEVDGIYGDKTFNAICDFQERYALGADGYASHNGVTWKKIDELMGGKHATIKPNWRGKDVVDMCKALNLFGYRTNGIGGNYISEDGTYGEAGHSGLFNAMCQFQDDYNMGADGIASATGVTWRKVDELYGDIEQVKVTASALNVRRGRGTDTELICTIANGSWHKKTNEVGGWAYLHDVGGWVNCLYIK